MRRFLIALAAVAALPAGASVLDPSAMPSAEGGSVLGAGAALEAMTTGIDGVGGILQALQARADAAAGGPEQLIDAAVAVPVPAGLPLLVLGLGALGLAARRRG